MTTTERYEALRSMIKVHVPAKEQAVALELLEELVGHPWHELEVTADGWAIRHPLSCRDDMLSCAISRKMSRRRDPLEPGRYKVFDVPVIKDGLEFWPVKS